MQRPWGRVWLPRKEHSHPALGPRTCPDLPTTPPAKVEIGQRSGPFSTGVLKNLSVLTGVHDNYWRQLLSNKSAEYM